MGVPMGLLEPVYGGSGGFLVALAHLVVQLHDAVPVLLALSYVSAQIRKRGAYSHGERWSNPWCDSYPAYAYAKLILHLL